MAVLVILVKPRQLRFCKFFYFICRIVNIYFKFAQKINNQRYIASIFPLYIINLQNYYLN